MAEDEQDMEAQLQRLQLKMQQLVEENAELHRQRLRQAASGVGQEVRLCWLCSTTDLRARAAPWGCTWAGSTRSPLASGWHKSFTMGSHKFAAVQAVLWAGYAAELRDFVDFLGDARSGLPLRPQTLR